MKLHRLPLLITSFFALASCGSAVASSQTSEHTSSSAQEKQSSAKNSSSSSAEVSSSGVETFGEESSLTAEGSASSGEASTSSDVVSSSIESSYEDDSSSPSASSPSSSNGGVESSDETSLSEEFSSGSERAEISSGEKPSTGETFYSEGSSDAETTSLSPSSDTEPSSDYSKTEPSLDDDVSEESSSDDSSGDEVSSSDDLSSDSESSSSASLDGAETSEISSSVEEMPEVDEETKKSLGMTPVLSEDGKSLTYGLYPQTHVSDTSTVDSLNKLAAAEGDRWYLLGDEYYTKATADPCGSSPEFDDGTPISSETVYWFKCEPIKWDILKTEEDSYFLLSDRLLDVHRYNERYTGTKNGYYANNYKNSEIRAWLNGAFCNSAFSLDSSFVMETDVDNSASTTFRSSNSYACESTGDKVFLPSYQDLKNADYGFSTDYSTEDTARQCKTTDWARANSAACDYLYNGFYWARSPSPWDSDCASCVFHTGCLDSGGNVNYSFGAVRPCIVLQRNA
jgi:hypothetical protein